LALVILSPVFLLTIIGILMSDWGPIFYMANRIGKGNKPFKMYKFRSMKVLKAPKKGSEASLRPDEDRIFPFGRFIRKVKIDEWPQPLNILNGPMSFIGPRPVAQDQFDMFRYGKWDEAKKVPVGLSGPAALYDFIYGDQFTDEDEYMEKVYPTRRELEYTYVQKAGCLYDIKMIIYTVICIVYALFGKECTWILSELLADAKKSNPELDVQPHLI
jgi:lipopolysaccharide/colanic/teichoic acid biosynthesis glycosyltransferase